METTTGSSKSFTSTFSSFALIWKIEENTENTRIDTIITTNKKLVPQRGCSRVMGRTFSTVSGSFAS